MSTESALTVAYQRLSAIQAEIARLEKRQELEESFNQDGEIYLVVRHNIDNGRIDAIEGAFSVASEANRYAKSLPGYGLNKDLFVRPVSYYTLGD